MSNRDTKTRYGHASDASRRSSARIQVREDEEQHSSASSRSSSGSIRHTAMHASSKAKADRLYERYARKNEDPAPDDSAPRAALYEGKTGRKQHKAEKLIKKNDSMMATSASLKRSPKKPSHWKRRVIVAAACVACAAFAVFFLYDPAKQYYQQIREVDRLQAEYDAISERNDQLQREVDRLSTEVGIEDKAREEFGWVLDGENSVSVIGLDTNDVDIKANITDDQIDYPDTWYSPILDPIFGVGSSSD